MTADITDVMPMLELHLEVNKATSDTRFLPEVIIVTSHITHAMPMSEPLPAVIELTFHDTRLLEVTEATSGITDAMPREVNKVTSFMSEVQEMAYSAQLQSQSEGEKATSQIPCLPEGLERPIQSASSERSTRQPLMSCLCPRPKRRPTYSSSSQRSTS